MIVNSQDDVLYLLKMYMNNTNTTQGHIANNVGTNRPQVNRTLNGKHAVNLDTLIKYVHACNANLEINITPMSQKQIEKIK